MTQQQGPRRPGFSTVTPYLIVDNAPALARFVAELFGAEELDRTLDDDGRLRHASFRLGDSMIEMSSARAEWKARPGSLHVYWEDVDGCFRRALELGAESLHEPMTMDYGEYGAALEDPFGNHWYLARYLGD
ncbi:MAG: VOC family protein [Acidobacteriota bacterium]